MEALNRTLFLWINAPAQADPFTVSLATLCAQQIIWLIPLILGVGWLYGNAHGRRVTLVATVSTLLALGANLLIGRFWPHPRPFMLGIGHQYLPHVADASFPSDHMTVLSATAGSFLLYRGFRLLGVTLALLSLPVAWARIYLGVHFPLDMAGAVLVAALTSTTASLCAGAYLPGLYRLSTLLHRRLFARLIDAGWIQP